MKTVLVIDCLLDAPYGSPNILKHILGSQQGSVFLQRGPGLTQTEVDTLSSLFRNKTITHMVISGSRTSCLNDEPWVAFLLKLILAAEAQKVPILGICFGHQMIARAFGGKEVLGKAPVPEKGWIEVNATPTSRKALAASLPPLFGTDASHVECVHTLPRGFEKTFTNDACGIQGFQSLKGEIHGVQFHPERQHPDTAEENLVGQKLFQEFLKL